MLNQSPYPLPYPAPIPHPPSQCSSLGLLRRLAEGPKGTCRPNVGPSLAVLVCCRQALGIPSHLFLLGSTAVVWRPVGFALLCALQWTTTVGYKWKHPSCNHNPSAYNGINFNVKNVKVHYHTLGSKHFVSIFMGVICRTNNGQTNWSTNNEK